VVNTGTWSDLADGDGIQKLSGREPVPTLDEIRAQERQQNVSTAEEDRSDFQKEKEDR
jgi:hypothetical protein